MKYIVLLLSTVWFLPTFSMELNEYKKFEETNKLQEMTETDSLPSLPKSFHELVRFWQTYHPSKPIDKSCLPQRIWVRSPFPEDPAAIASHFFSLTAQSKSITIEAVLWKSRKKVCPESLKNEINNCIKEKEKTSCFFPFLRTNHRKTYRIVFYSGNTLPLSFFNEIINLKRMYTSDTTYITRKWYLSQTSPRIPIILKNINNIRKSVLYRGKDGKNYCRKLDIDKAIIYELNEATS